MGGGGHGGPEAVALLPVAGLPGFRGDLPEWSYQQVISRERNARPSRRRSNSFATARQHPSSIVGRAGNCALALPHQQSDVFDVEDGGEDAKAADERFPPRR